MKEELKSVTAKHFDAYAINWENRLKDHCYLTRYNTVKAMLKHSITDIVDLGCGTGDYSNLFSASVNYIGIDNSSGMINRAKALYPNRKFLFQDVENTSIPDNYADCVLAMGLFEYLEDPSKLVKEIWRITKKNGQVICSFSNKNDITKKRISLFARPMNLGKKAIRIFFKKRENQNPLAPKGYIKDPRILHKRFDEKTVLRLFDSSKFIHLKTRFADFNISAYFTGIPLLRRLDDYISTIITAHSLDRFFSNYGSMFLVSFNKHNHNEKDI